MSTPSEPIKSPAPESPTTARPLEMDDDDVPDSGIPGDETTAAGAKSVSATTTTAAATPAAAATISELPATSSAAAEELPPPKPPRPLTEQQKNEQTLKEAFPTVDMPVVKAVLTASRGNIEAAFHALLEMTDPDAASQEPQPPPPPPRPTQVDSYSPSALAAAAATGRLSPHSQMLADEQLARELAQRYESEQGAYEARTSSGGGRHRTNNGPAYPPRPTRASGTGPTRTNDMWGGGRDDYDREPNFIDDDLPAIRENLRKGFVETQTKFNTWFSGIKKRIDEEFNTAGDDDDDDDDLRPNNSNSSHPNDRRHGGPQQQQQQPYPRRTPTGGAGRGGFGNLAGPPRRSGDYDADPELLSDDFAGIQLHGDGTPVHRAGNTNVFRPPSTSPRPGQERKVAFRDATENIYSASPKLPTSPGQAGTGAGAGAGAGASAKASKWQPLSAVDPTPMAETDPFSLGDSEDEKDVTVGSGGSAASKTAASKTDETAAKPAASPEDAERLRRAAAEAMADSLVEDKANKP